MKINYDNQFYPCTNSGRSLWANIINLSNHLPENTKKYCRCGMRNAVLMKDDITNDPTELGIIAETAVYKHIKAFYFKDAATVGYIRGDKKDKEIDIVVKSERFRPIMIEVKYRDQAKIAEDDEIVLQANDLYPNIVITKRANDFGVCMYGDKKYTVCPPLHFCIY